MGEVAEDRDTLAELIVYNQQHAASVMPWFDQEIFQLAQARGDLSDETYLKALNDSGDAMRDMLDGLFSTHEVDVLVIPSNSPAWKTDWVKGDHFAGVYSSIYAAVSGYPSITVPAGFKFGLPLGISFIGPALSDAELVQIAYVFEQHTQARRAPQFIPSLEVE